MLSEEKTLKIKREAKIMKKRIMLSVLLAIAMCLSVMTSTASATETLKGVGLPKPAAPHYFKVEDSGGSDSFYIYSVLDNSMIELATEHNVDENAFYTKYGIENEGYNHFGLYMQYDVNVNGKGWQYTSEWDEVDGYTGNYERGYDCLQVGGEKVEEFTLHWLIYYDGSHELYEDAVYADGDGYRFNTDSTIQIRCRYYMEYRDNDENFTSTSDWSDVAVFGKGSTQKNITAPISYAAPIISKLEVVPPEGTNDEAHIYFELDTPDSVWDADMYHAMNDEGGLEELHAQINVNGGEWKNLYVSNSHWPLYEGSRQTSSTEMLTSESYVQLRVRYGGPLGFSDWSNILSVNAPAFEASDWAVDFVTRADEMGLIPECLEGEDLTKDITRAEFAAVAVKTYEALSGVAAIPAVNNPFVDTNDVEVLKAYNMGITAGVSATEFQPNTLLNREQAATMLTNVFKKVSIAGWTSATNSQYKLDYEKPALFADDADISSWAKDSVYFMAANGIISGMGNNKFAPKNVTSEEEATGYANATREQALIIAVKMVENLKK